MGLRSLIAEKIASRVLGNGKTRRAVMNELLDQDTLLFRDLGDHAFAFFPTDAIGRSLFQNGEFARGSVTDLRTFLEQNNAYKPGMSVLEVGANIGTQTVYFFLDLQCDAVVAIEPDPDNMNLLRHNLALNGLTDKVEILGVAASDTSGTAEFTRDLFNRGGSRLGAKRTSGKTRESFSVEIIRIDDLVQSGALQADQIGLVWMDVEGHELSALKGMKQLITDFRPPIFLEFTPDGQHSTQQELCDLLFDNYRGVYRHAGGFHPVSRDAFAQIKHQVDLLVI
ncbi:FkbM family methyltransferase [Ruegeria sp. R13_0]|uniref:FkbM family methyltransferase n=1 Tax=Ruegeria sp. R13_0 TaxID=2821099 RepID=UPI001ADB7DD1|nr:FkbM family methyltransferase [Ruegeria sp. R13_0]MBO9436251.1 FkbM family methyltransferase [Ruegeria sp. R13_0]